MYSFLSDLMRIPNLLQRTFAGVIIGTVISALFAFYPIPTASAADSLTELQTLSKTYGDSNGNKLMAASDTDLGNLLTKLNKAKSDLPSIATKEPSLQAAHYIMTDFYVGGGVVENRNGEDEANRGSRYASLGTVLDKISRFTNDFKTSLRNHSPSTPLDYTAQDYALYLARNFSALDKYISANRVARDGLMPNIDLAGGKVFDMPDADQNGNFLISSFTSENVGGECSMSEPSDRISCGLLLLQAVSDIKNKKKDLSAANRVNDGFIFSNESEYLGGSGDADFGGIDKRIEKIHDEISEPWKAALEVYIQLNADIVKKKFVLHTEKDGKYTLSEAGVAKLVELEKQRQEIKKRLSASTKAYDLLDSSFMGASTGSIVSSWWNNGGPGGEKENNIYMPYNLETVIAKGYDTSEIAVHYFCSEKPDAEFLCLEWRQLTGSVRNTYNSTTSFVEDYKRLEGVTPEAINGKTLEELTAKERTRDKPLSSPLCSSR